MSLKTVNTLKVVKTIDEVRQLVNAERKNGKAIGFVPTMGYLHEGHLSLMQEARRQMDYVVVSIFVNPTQFGPNEDLASYPRDLARDLELCESVGVDLVFAPEVSEMYPEGYSTYVECEGDMTQKLCGASRPSHFKGVTSVVCKLFNIVKPDQAFFGQKDAQQVAVIEKMVRDLSLDVAIIPCPIVRESDGLAMSSRNSYLSETERQDALVLNRSLMAAKEAIQNGERSATRLINEMRKNIEACPSAVVDYISIVDAKTLEDIENLEADVLVAIAVKIGKTRLIDNFRLNL